MDTTYFGRSYGILTLMDNRTSKVIYHKKVSYEKNEYYKLAIAYLQAQGFIIHSITCDGRRGLLGGFKSIPTQMCHFHQRQIITRYLTRKPKHIASIELLNLSKLLGQVNQAQFVKLLDKWYLTHENYLNERSYSEDNKRCWYTHKRLRQAYFSLRRNTKYLFVYQDNPYIPNTTNKLEGLFSQIKQKLRCHQGLSQDRQLKFIDDFMIGHGWFLGKIKTDNPSIKIAWKMSIREGYLFFSMNFVYQTFFNDCL